MDIITLAEYKAFDDSPSPLANDTQVEAAIDAATAWIENYTGRVFEIADNPSPVEEVDELTGTGTSRIYTRQAPVTAVTSIHYWDGDSWEEMESTQYDFTFDEGTNIVRFTDGTTFHQASNNIGFRNWKITYEYGYTASLPNDLKFACYLLTRYLITEGEYITVTYQMNGEQAFTYRHEMPPFIVAVLRRFRTVW